MYAINDDYSYTGEEWGIACGQADLTGDYDGLGKARSADVQIVIFYPAAPEITSCGINIFNAAGQCTWSSKFTPFLLRGIFQLSRNWGGVNGVNRPMVPVTMPGMYFRANDYQRYYGIKSNGSEFAVTTVTSSYATRGPGYTLDIINPISLPVISANDYF